MFKKYVYSDLFRLLPQSFKVSKLEFVSNGRTPAYSSDTSNNGRLGYVNRRPQFSITEETPVYLIFGDHTKTMNIVHEDFCVMDNVKVLTPKREMSDEVLLYITTSWKKAIPNLGYARHWSVAKNAQFELPVIESSDPDHKYTIDDIDYEYMQNRIAELEQNRIAELNLYLKATGLDDYALTDEDREVLYRSTKCVSDKAEALEADSQDMQIRFRKFIVGSLFTRVYAKCRKKDFDKRRDTSTVRNNEFCIPLINAKLGDNGIMFYGRRADWNTQRMCIDVIQNGAVATGKVYAQPEPVAVLWDAYLIKIKPELIKINPEYDIKTAEVLLYLAKCIEKITKEQFSYDKKATWDRVKLCEISLPVNKSGVVDFAYMERYIRAIEKLTIAEVVKYKDEVIDTTRKIIV